MLYLSFCVLANGYIEVFVKWRPEGILQSDNHVGNLFNSTRIFRDPIALRIIRAAYATSMAAGTIVWKVSAN